MPWKTLGHPAPRLCSRLMLDVLDEGRRIFSEPLGCEGSIYFRIGIDRDLEILAICNYTAYVNVARVLEKIKTSRRASSSLRKSGQTCSALSRSERSVPGPTPKERSAPKRSLRSPVKPGRKEQMNRKVINLIAAAERNDGYADVPPSSIDDEIECELAIYGYAVAYSDRLWLGGYRVHSPESIQAGNYNSHVPPSIFTCASSKFAHVPDARDFDVEAVLEMRGEIRSN